MLHKGCQAVECFRQDIQVSQSEFSSCYTLNSMIHYIDVIMTTMVSQITSLTVVYSAVYSDIDQIKHQSSASLAFVWGIHRDRWIPRTKGQLRGKCFHLMTSSCCFAQCVMQMVQMAPVVYPIYSLISFRYKSGAIQIFWRYLLVIDDIGTISDSTDSIKNRMLLHWFITSHEHSGYYWNWHLTVSMISKFPRSMNDITFTS